MMRMQQSIIDCLMAADHVFRMTRFRLGDYRDMGEKARHTCNNSDGETTGR